ncbi:MAG TPA: exodeoxyribonuclease VII small subunit [Rhodocyclaceae bacterium]|nr:exodeoxyribonuclease VII small subunit [Rhodocyclaceae bacterium]
MSAAVPPSFEAALKELEAIVQAMEAGEAPLEESLAAYERGLVLLKHCQDTLSAAERRLQILEDGALRDFKPAGEEERKD